MATCCTYHQPSSPTCYTTAIPNSLSLINQKILKPVWEKKSEEWASRGKKKKKTEGVTGVSRTTRKEIVKWNQMTALRFPTGRTSDIPGLPSGSTLWKKSKTSRQ